MFLPGQFDFCFRQEKGIRSSAAAQVQEHFPLSSTITTRILLIETESELEDQPLFARAVMKANVMKANLIETNRRKSLAGNLDPTVRTQNVARTENVVQADGCAGLNSDGGSASALPPPQMSEQETFESEGETSWHDGLLPPETLPSETLLQETRSALHRLQDALEHAGHQVVVWPCGLASSVLARDLLDFEIVVVRDSASAQDALFAENTFAENAFVEDGARAQDAVSLCRILKAAATESGACLVAALSSQAGADEAGANEEPERVARRVRAFQEAGVDGILDCDAPLHQIASVVRTIAQLARTRRELEATHAQLRLQLQTDDLTNLLNRRFFFQAAHREYERSRRTNSPLSCLMVDLNHFRRLSESFGFECCDAALRCVANVLREAARDGDIVARFGEGKFVFLLPETSLSQAAQIGEMLQRAVSEHAFIWRGQTLPMTISVGEATRPVQSKTTLPHFAHNNPDDTRNNAGSNSREPLPNKPLPDALPMSESLDMRTAFSAREEIGALLEEADAALFVAKRGVRSSSLLDTPPLLLSRPGYRA